MLYLLIKKGDSGGIIFHVSIFKIWGNEIEMNPIFCDDEWGPGESIEDNTLHIQLWHNCSNSSQSWLTTVETEYSDSDIRNKLIWGLAADTTKEFLRCFQTFLEDLVSHHWKK